MAKFTQLSGLIERQRVQLEDKAWRDQLTQIVETVAAGIIVINKAGRVVFANPEAARIFGLTQAAMIGRRFNDQRWKIRTLNGGVVPEEKHAFSRVMKTGKPVYGVEAAVDRRDGSTAVVSLNAAPLKNEDGAVIGVVKSCIDITEKKRAEEALRTSEERYRTLAESARDAIYVVDRQDRVQYVNLAGAHSIGRRVGELIGRHINDVFPPEISREFDDYRQKVVHSRRPQSFEELVQFRGKEFWLDTQLVPIRNGGGDVSGVMGISRDITKRKREEAKQRTERDLSDALNKINSAISSTLSTDQVMQRVVAEAGEAIGCESTAIILREDGRWVIKYVHHMSKGMVGRRLTDERAKHLRSIAESRRMLIVNDARKDRRVDSHLMRELGIRSFLALPLIAKNEFLGVLSFNYRSGAVAFADSHKDFAGKLAASISVALETARLFETERDVSHTLQEALLTVPGNIPGVDFGHLYRSATEAAKIGGDFYDLFEVDSGKVCLMIGDVSGKGLESAALTTLVKSTIKAYSFLEDKPSAIIAKTNEVVRRTCVSPTFVTVFFGILNIESGELAYCDAGHPPPILKRKAGKTSVLAATSPAVGVFGDLRFGSGREVLDEEDILLLYTDGVTEARYRRGFFGENRLMGLLDRLNLTVGVEALPQAIYEGIASFTKGALADDLALLAVSVQKK